MKEKRELFIGIDVACALGKRLPVAALVRQGNLRRLVSLKSTGTLPPKGMGNQNLVEGSSSSARVFAKKSAAWLEKVGESIGLPISRIAIDAPQRPSQQSGRRECELAMGKAGIFCFATPSKQEFDEKRTAALDHLRKGGPVSKLPSANLWWMLVGFELFEVLSEKWECLETYPNAVLHEFEYNGLHKSKDSIAQLNLVKSKSHIVDLDVKVLNKCVFGNAHDRVDAVMCAWVASLEVGQRRAYGVKSSEQIWLPRARS